MAEAGFSLSLTGCKTLDLCLLPPTGWSPNLATNWLCDLYFLQFLYFSALPHLEILVALSGGTGMDGGGGWVQNLCQGSGYRGAGSKRPLGQKEELGK